MTWYRRTHSCIKAAKIAVVRLSTKLENHRRYVAVDVETVLGGASAGRVPELFELAAWS